ncbi:hypothetical protein BVRB_2g031240 [Beta vulgaris subsp. vulgaris]|nr:hypothetical protein BVRB_2g031240 [Beta vulgaris subsp. vulgaris]
MLEVAEADRIMPKPGTVLNWMPLKNHSGQLILVF